MNVKERAEQIKSKARTIGREVGAAASVIAVVPMIGTLLFEQSRFRSKKPIKVTPISSGKGFKDGFGDTPTSAFAPYGATVKVVFTDGSGQKLEGIMYDNVQGRNDISGHTTGANTTFVWGNEVVSEGEGDKKNFFVKGVKGKVMVESVDKPVRAYITDLDATLTHSRPPIDRR